MHCAPYMQATLVQRTTSAGYTPLTWSTDDVQKYARDYLLPGAAVSVALLALSATVFLTFVIWWAVGGTASASRTCCVHHSNACGWAAM